MGATGRLVFVEAIHLKVRDGRGANRRVYIGRPLTPMDEAQTRFLEFSQAWGEKYPPDRAVVGERGGRIRRVPAVRPRDPPDRVHHERDRIQGASGGCAASTAGTEEK